MIRINSQFCFRSLLGSLFTLGCIERVFNASSSVTLLFSSAVPIPDTNTVACMSIHAKLVVLINHKSCGIYVYVERSQAAFTTTARTEVHQCTELVYLFICM
jgi:hypothetical protein